jgi:hypothetical protein
MLARSLILVLFLGTALQAQQPERFQQMGSAERIFVAKLTQAQAGPVGLSDPPLYSFRLEFAPGKGFRGTGPGKEVFQYSIRTRNQPAFTLDKEYLVAANGSKIVTVDLATDEDVALAKKLAALPAGWSLEKGKPVSPWASLGEKAWPKDGPKLAEEVCTKSGRPALMCGEGITLIVEQIPPANPMKFKNDYGDGLFRVIVTNTTGKKATIPALLMNERGEVLWADSLFLTVNGKPVFLTNAGKVTAGTKPVTLEAGAKLVGEINTLASTYADWPRGGSRVNFQFQLGEKGASNFFYYYSQWHDGLRAKALRP